MEQWLPPLTTSGRHCCHGCPCRPCCHPHSLSLLLSFLLLSHSFFVSLWLTFLFFLSLTLLARLLSHPVFFSHHAHSPSFFLSCSSFFSLAAAHSLSLSFSLSLSLSLSLSHSFFSVDCHFPVISWLVMVFVVCCLLVASNEYNT